MDTKERNTKRKRRKTNRNNKDMKRGGKWLKSWTLDLKISEFEVQLFYYVLFQTNNPWEMFELLYSTPAMGSKVSQLFFGIK